MLNDFIQLWLPPDFIYQVGECGYQRALSCLAVGVPLLFTAFVMACTLLLLYGIYRLVCRA